MIPPIIETDVDLQAYNTLGLPAIAEKFTTVEAPDQLVRLLGEAQDLPILVLGGGSNVLLAPRLPYLVLQNNLRGIQVLQETADDIELLVASGENWHQLVQWTLQHHYGGLENLSLIPGTVGAAPIQNIGAYGVEFADVCTQVRAVRLHDGLRHTFTTEECQFGYRESIFKGDQKGQWFITDVGIRLRKTDHQLHLDYGAIRTQLAQSGISQASIQDISRAVIAIRQSKLPDWRELGNAGSFFKNPVLSAAAFSALAEKQATPIPHYPQADGQIKVPAGWLIEQAGWKGKRLGAVGTYPKQALVMVHYGGGSGTEVLAFAEKIQAAVYEQFGVALEREVTAVGFCSSQE